LADGTYDADNLTYALLTATPTDATAQDWNTDGNILSELSTSEVASYAREAMGTATIAEDDTGNEATIDYADIDFGALEAPAITPALECTAGVAIDLTSSEVMWVQAFAAGATPTGATFKVIVPTDGLAAVVHG
jgi:hypothetical protein